MDNIYRGQLHGVTASEAALAAAHEHAISVLTAETEEAEVALRSTHDAAVKEAVESAVAVEVSALQADLSEMKRLAVAAQAEANTQTAALLAASQRHDAAVVAHEQVVGVLRMEHQAALESQQVEHEATPIYFSSKLNMSARINGLIR